MDAERQATMDRLGFKVGAKVVRGPQWRWGEQDGGSGNVGTITKLKEWGLLVDVRWPNGDTNNYGDAKYNYEDIILASHSTATPAYFEPLYSSLFVKGKPMGPCFVSTPIKVSKASRRRAILDRLSIE